MFIESIILILSLLALILIYVSRVKSTTSGSFLFNEHFLVKTDEKIFEVVKFVFKKYTYFHKSVSNTLKKVPHAILHAVHKISHRISLISSHWVERIKKGAHSDKE